MSEKYPGLELERFNKANLWIKYIIFKIMRFLKDDMLEVGAGLGSFTKGYMKKFHSITLTDTDEDNLNLLKKNFLHNQNINIIKS